MSTPDALPTAQFVPVVLPGTVLEIRTADAVEVANQLAQHLTGDELTRVAFTVSIRLAEQQGRKETPYLLGALRALIDYPGPNRRRLAIARPPMATATMIHPQAPADASDEGAAADAPDVLPRPEAPPAGDAPRPADVPGGTRMSNPIELPEFTVEGYPGATWVKSSESTPGTLDDCVALARLEDGGIGLADTKTGTALAFTPSEMSAFIKGAKNGEFDQFA